MSLTALYDLPAPAKINLFLHVIGRRPDGYHLLQSIFLLLDWADTLHLELRRDGVLRRHDLGAALPAEDLCLKAARALQQASGCNLGADISIAKEVPWGAGLGGGSSDAATVLIGLNRLWQLDWPRERLLALGATLGADVPFFIGGRPAFVEGIGEILTPIELPPQRWAVLKPEASIATPKIFSSELLTRDTKPATVAGLLDVIRKRLTEAEASSETSATSTDVSSRKNSVLVGQNDLQAVAESLCPEVSKACHWLERQFGNSRMTGSGSAVFAHLGKVVDSAISPSVATKPESAWPSSPDHPGWTGRLCNSLTAHPLVDWSS